MTRTHAFFALAAALTLAVALQPIGHWLSRRAQPSVTPAVSAQTRSGALSLVGALSHERPLEGAPVYVRYDIRASETRPTAEQPVQMALVLDRSGSMAGEKLLRAKLAAQKLIDLLGENDELAVVTFGSDTHEFDLTRATPEGKQRLHAFVEGIVDNGGTNISAALVRADSLLKVAPQHGVRRVVLVSDGQPSDGITAPDQLVSLVSRLHQGQVAVTALGVGSDFNGPLMQRIAEQGGGFYAYLNDPQKLSEVLGLELTQARGAVARNVALTLTLPDNTGLVQVVGREVVRNGSEITVALPDFAPNQSAQAYLELTVPADQAAVRISAQLRYVDPSNQERISTGLLELVATTTDEPALSEKSKNAAVASDCIRAVGTTKMVQAAAAFERGDRTSAFDLLFNARTLFATSADSLAGNIDDVTQTQKRWEQTHDADAIRRESLGVNRKVMENFGTNNAY